MRKLPRLFALLAACVLAASSCGKEGAIGPQGDKGDQGLVGAAGPKGTNGKNGSMIYAGTTAPSSSTGAVGDYYLNKSNSLLYGPKTASGWGTGYSLKGATGAKGAAGNTVLSGSGIPSASLGKTGDFYLDKSTYLMYGPKAANGWGAATSLKGAKGATGTANVQYSGWLTAENFRDTIIDNSNFKIATLLAPGLTTSLLNDASIQVYFSFNAGVFPMPYTSNAGGLQNTLTFIPQENRFLITRFTADNSASINISTSLQYRYVIIPGAVALSLKNNHVDMSDYQAISQFVESHQ